MHRHLFSLLMAAAGIAALLSGTASAQQYHGYNRPGNYTPGNYGMTRPSGYTPSNFGMSRVSGYTPSNFGNPGASIPINLAIPGSPGPGGTPVPFGLPANPALTFGNQVPTPETSSLFPNGAVSPDTGLFEVPSAVPESQSPFGSPGGNPAAGMANPANFPSAGVGIYPQSLFGTTSTYRTTSNPTMTYGSPYAAPPSQSSFYTPLTRVYGSRGY